MKTAYQEGAMDSVGMASASGPLSVDALGTSPELAALRESEARYRFLAENTSDIIVRASMDGVVLYASPAVRMLGYEPEALVGTSAHVLVHPDDLEHFEANAAALFTDGPAVPMLNREHRYRTASGEWVWLEGNPRVVRDEAGVPIEIVNAFRNVTERRALREQAARQASLAALGEEVAGVGYWRFDIASEELTWSKQVYKIYGLEPETTPSIALLVDLMPPEDRPMARLRFEAAIKQGTDWKRSVTRIVRPDGEMRYFEGHGVCERNAEGIVTALFGTVVDITERIRDEAAKAESEKRYRRMSERALLAAQAAQIGIWEHDLRTDALLWDERMFQLYGLANDTVLTFDLFRAAVHPEDREPLAGKFHALLERDVPLEAEFRIVQPNGDVRLIRAMGGLERDADGAPLRIVGGNWDVTALRSLEDSLRASEARARNIITHANQAIVTIDDAGLITGWNRHAQSLFGWNAEEAIGAPMTALIIPLRDREAHRAGLALLSTAAEGDVIDQRSEITVLRKDGGELPVELAVSVVRGPSGLEITALMHDISERKAQLELFENAFQHAAIGKTLVGLDGAFLKVNPALCALVGYSESELLALDFQAITHPDDLDADLDLLRQLTEGAISTYRMDKRYFRKDGTTIWVRLVVSLVVNPDGSPRHYISQIQDLTARRQAERALRESEARYRLMAENTTDMIVTTDLTGVTTYIAPSCELRTGYTPEELIGRRSMDYAHPDDVQGVRDVFIRLVAGAPSETARWRVRHKITGETVWLESSPSLIRDPDSGAPTGFLDVVRDVTDKVAQEQALATARAEAEAAAQVKAEFLANMSHEIRTPLTAVIGFSGLLHQRPELDEVSRRFVQRVSIAGEALLSIVNDILDFSKLEAGQVEIEPCPTSPIEVAEDALALFTPQADEKGLWLECEVVGDLPAHLIMDPNRVRQILLNLIGNAVKFTDAGSVRLLLDYDHDAGALRIQVRDTGPGMSVEQQEKLFQRFSQVDASNTRKHGGTGLGLAICKGLAEAMGGQIGAISQVGEGSTFWFTLAAPVVDLSRDPRMADQAPGLSLDGVRVLVVDDNDINRELARVVLESFGADVMDAPDGASAIATAASELFDAILLDLRMPGLSGAETLKAIRAGHGPNQDVPILAFTAESDLSTLGEDHGFDDMIAKPIVALDLARTIIEHTSWAIQADDEQSKDIARV
jgi:PAS domain S-box-containing protein